MASLMSRLVQLETRRPAQVQRIFAQSQTDSELFYEGGVAITKAEIDAFSDRGATCIVIEYVSESENYNGKL